MHCLHPPTPCRKRATERCSAVQILKWKKVCADRPHAWSGVISFAHRYRSQFLIWTSQLIFGRNDNLPETLSHSYRGFPHKSWPFPSQSKIKLQIEPGDTARRLIVVAEFEMMV